MSNISTTTAKHSQLDGQHQSNNLTTTTSTSPLSSLGVYSQGNNASSSFHSSLISSSNKESTSTGSSPMETTNNKSSTICANNLQSFFPQLFFPSLIPSSSSSTSSPSSSSAFVSSSTPQNRSSFSSSSTSALNRTDFVSSPINGQQQNLNGDGNGGGGLFGSSSNTFLQPPPTHQFSSLQQIQQQNLFFQRQQQQQQMQQSQQQQLHRNSPRIQFPPQQLATQNNNFDNHQQIWFNLLSAIALGNSNGIPQTPSTSDASQQQLIGGTDIRTISADKKLERDSEGNALCPACHEPIGKDSAQWAKHLDMERGKLQKSIQFLRERTIKQKISEMDNKNDNNNINLLPNNNNLYKQNTFININGREALLDKVRNNQRKRMEAKFDVKLFNNFKSTTTSAPCTTNDSVDSINNNNLNNNIDENKIEISSSNNDQMEWKQPTLPSKIDCKNEIETFATKNEPNDVSEQLESTTTCFSCQRIADCLVLNVRSRMFRCLECFKQQQKHQQTWCNNTNNNVVSNNENQNGFINNSAAVVLEGFQQNIENKKKRVSPPFSALELASSPGELFGGTKRTRVESEH